MRRDFSGIIWADAKKKVWKQSMCAEASQILLTAGQNLKFRPRSQRKTLRNGGRNERGKED